MTGPRPYTCTLTPAEAPVRMEQIRTLTRGLRARERRDREVRLRFDAPLAAVVRAFVRDETRCCGFFDFTLTEGEETVELRVRAPAGAEQLLDSLSAAFDPASDSKEGTDDR